MRRKNLRDKFIKELSAMMCLFRAAHDTSEDEKGNPDVVMERLRFMSQSSQLRNKFVETWGPPEGESSILDDMQTIIDKHKHNNRLLGESE